MGNEYLLMGLVSEVRNLSRKIKVLNQSKKFRLAALKNSEVFVKMMKYLVDELKIYNINDRPNCGYIYRRLRVYCDRISGKDMWDFRGGYGVAHMQAINDSKELSQIIDACSLISCASKIGPNESSYIAEFDEAKLDLIQALQNLCMF